MPTTEADIPDSVRDILDHMPADMRQRVLMDYDTHYAPFLAMLAGWKGAVQEHYAHGQDAAIARLEEQFFPLADWDFPSQTLAAPRAAPERTVEIGPGAAFTEPGARRWIASGAGWLQPTALRSGRLQPVNRDIQIVVEADYAGSARLETALERGQLAFVAAGDEAIAGMEGAEWWLQTPDQTARRAAFIRYAGYMDFEREMQTARLNQRQLDLWLPPFHPYARKMVLLRAAPGEGAGAAPADLDWMPEVRGGFRFVGLVREPDRALRRALEAAREVDPLFRLNAVPLIQAGVEDCSFFAPFPEAGGQFVLRMAGVPDLFAASAYSNSGALAATMDRVPGADPDATEPDVEVRIARGDAGAIQVRLYYGSAGHAGAGATDAPAFVERASVRFEAPYPPLGGLTVRGPESRAAWAREAWYNGVLRPPLLTEGDLVELVAQRSRGTLEGVLRFAYATREIHHDPEQSRLHWRSYLWPSLVAREEHFDPRFEGIPSGNYVALIQSLALAFERGPAAARLPEFLLSDAASYFASILSQYFVLSCFRVEGRIV